MRSSDAAPAARPGVNVCSAIACVAQDEAVDVPHHVEGATVDRLVVAEGRGREGPAPAVGSERLDDAVLPAHVVGGGQHMAHRRAAQDIAPAVRVGDPEGEVGAAVRRPARTGTGSGRRRRCRRATERRGRRRCPRCPRPVRSLSWRGKPYSGAGAALPGWAEMGRASASVTFSVMPTDVTDATFESAVIDRSATKTVVVDLWAPWCGPCRTLGPVLEKVVDEAGDDVELVKVNIDENPQVAGRLPRPVHPGRVRGQGPGDRRRVHRRHPRGPGPLLAGRAGPGRRREADQLVAARRRGVPPPGARARARPHRRHRGPGRAARVKGDPASTEEALAAPRPHPRVARDPTGRRPGPHHGGRRLESTATSKPSSTTCWPGSRTTRPPGRSSSTCSR